jgi:tellurite resistance protein
MGTRVQGGFGRRSETVRATMLEQWSRRLGQHRNRPFLEAAMAAAALVSTADDDVRLSEQVALDELMDRIDRLSAFDPHIGVELHRRHVDAIEHDRAAGREAAIQVLTTYRGGDEERLLILYVSAVIARADQELAESERLAMTAVCDALGLSVDESLARIWSRVAPDSPLS